MSLIQLTNVVVLDNPSPFLSPIRFQITLECLKEFEREIDWKLLYIGSAKDDK